MLVALCGNCRTWLLGYCSTNVTTTQLILPTTLTGGNPVESTTEWIYQNGFMNKLVHVTRVGEHKHTYTLFFCPPRAPLPSLFPLSLSLSFTLSHLSLSLSLSLSLFLSLSVICTNASTEYRATLAHRMWTLRSHTSTCPVKNVLN